MHALVFGYGQWPSGWIDWQTQDRCRKAAILYRRSEIEKIYLTVWVSKNGVAMADAMREFMISHGVKEPDIIVDKRGQNTAGEMDVFLSLVPPSRKVVFISTWYHIPRICWLALWRVPLSRFSVAMAWKRAHFKADVLVEFAKLANAILRPKKSAKVLSQSPAC